MQQFITAIIFLFLNSASCSSYAADLDVPLRFEDVTVDNIPICYDYACTVKDMITLSAEEWSSIQSLFKPHAMTSEQERSQLRRALGQLEIIAGQYTPIYKDTGGNSQGEWPGQMDCIDEATNVTTFLILLKKEGQLRFHKINTYAFRAPWIFDQHYSGHITDLQTGKHYAVDSWFLDAGQPPYIQPLEDWKQRKNPASGL